MIKQLFINGVGVMAIIEDEYYIEDELLEGYKKVNRDMFIEKLKNISWTCLTSWDKKLRQDYLDLVDYVNEMKEVK